jgi:hypothetical protein
MVAKLKLSQSNKEAVVAGLLKIGGSMLLRVDALKRGAAWLVLLGLVVTVEYGQGIHRVRIA